jgi:hypothetical protein
MLWYLANGSLNDYLKSQVLLQSQYYSGQNAQLLNAKFSPDNGSTHFDNLTLENISGMSQPLIFSLDKISAQLAQVPSSQLNSPSIQKKTTTLVHVEKVTLGNLVAWSEISTSGETNLALMLKRINIQLATDYPALYPEISAEMYAKQHPELNAVLADGESNKTLNDSVVEVNPAIIASKEAKKTKRLLGKALTRLSIASLVIDDLTLTSIVDGKEVTQHFTQINLGRFGDDNGLDTNQLGGEILRRLLIELIRIDKSNSLKES